MTTRRTGQVIKRGERVYLVRIYLGVDPDTGRRRYHNKTIHGTKKDAEAYKSRFLAAKDMGSYVEPSRMLLDEYLDQYLDTVKTSVAAGTFESYADQLRLYIRPELGRHQLSSITPLEIQNVYNAMSERGLSARVVRYAHSILKKALKQAVIWRMLSINPAEHLSLPRQRPKEMQTLSVKEARMFRLACAEISHGVLFELLLVTGLRPGEALGLKWGDVGLDENRLTVRRTLTRTKEFKEPKTPRARRTIPIPPSTTQALRRHRKQQLEDRLKAGPEYTDKDLVFADPKGFPLSHANVVRRHFKPLLVDLGLPESLRIYDLRHTCATLLLAGGENPKIVSERLGHASISLTLDTYSHVLPDMQAKAAEKLESMLY